MTTKATPKTNKAIKLAGTHRVFRIDEEAREAFKTARATAGLSVADAITQMISEDLPNLVAEILATGLRPRNPKARPARLPLGDNILQMQKASIITGVDQSALMVALLRRTGGIATVIPKAAPAKQNAKKVKGKAPVTKGARRGRKAVAK